MTVREINKDIEVTVVESGVTLEVVRGAKGDGLVWLGEWSSTYTYKKQHAVSRGGQSWVSLADGNLNNDPLADDGTYWDCLVADSLSEGYRDEALAYRDQAEGFAGDASTSADNALASENKAEKWAEEVEDTEVETGKYSALHHKEKALAAQTAAETAQGLSEGARDDALTYKNDAEAALLSILDYRGGIPV